MSELGAIIDTKGEYWVITKENNFTPEKTNAPHMYNLHMGVHFEILSIDDNHPFPRIKKHYKESYYFMLLLDTFSAIISKKDSSETRMVFAKETKNVCSEAYEMSFKRLREFLLDVELPEGADINKDLLDSMDDRFKDLTREVFQKHRNIDVFDL